MIEGTTHALLVTGARTWGDEAAMKDAFNSAWRTWGPSTVTRPLLISGHCPKGADAMAERLWRAAGFQVLEIPADWDKHGVKAGMERNTEMVRLAPSLQEQGIPVLCTAFLDRCTKDRCRQGRRQQLLPAVEGHFSHRTIHCRAKALAAGIQVFDVLQAPLRHA
ncbi:SLOG family protein [Pseudarthrobacter sp. NPDC058196]|uniref:SLOG family protein n=1 Tax=Pseudarthrobacter sp. NPDC058196 TaxID=3346376 RepID=UPI0036D868C7